VSQELPSIEAPLEQGFEQILTSPALAFLGELHARFEPVRRELLDARLRRRAELRSGASLDFARATQEIREDSEWRVAPPPRELTQRWVEITGPTDRKMMINALNSGADGFMADLEDANAPSWHNVIEGQINLRDAVRGTIAHTGSDGRDYRLDPSPATLHVRPRGWQLPERHLRVGGAPIAGALVDFGLFAFHNATALAERGAGPFLYLPKLESHREARLWNDVFGFVQNALGLPPGTIRATVLIETLPAAFEMEEILYELREHSAGLNAGRWDYIFSAIKCFAHDPGRVLPDRSAVTMTVPFMRSYTELLVATCHRRGAHAIGGMAALIPSRSDPQANERALAGVRSDKEREVGQGYDGTWVAHPDLVPCAREVFARGLDGRPNQIERLRDDVRVSAAELTALQDTPGEITEAGLRANVSVGFQYISFWLGGRGAAAINSLMEDAATAEISRAQLWQWVRHGARLADGRTVTAELVRSILEEETAAIRERVGEATWAAGHPEQTREVLERVALSEELIEFLTLVAYDLLT
jgi:malate synthase